MKHENIISFYGTRKDGDRQYIFLEYACGGELFDRIGSQQNFIIYSHGVCKDWKFRQILIFTYNTLLYMCFSILTMLLISLVEPDVGMSQSQAQKYFRDLINGVVRMNGNPNVFLILFSSWPPDNTEILKYESLSW